MLDIPATHILAIVAFIAVTIFDAAVLLSWGSQAGSTASDGNGSQRTCSSNQLGCCRHAPPFAPHFLQRAERRRTSLEASRPHRMISGV
jgi:hypothetical protein